MGFWREQVIEPVLADGMRREMAEQVEWIRREPANARPYYQLGALYRMQGDADRALGLLLEAVRLDAALTPAQAALAEVYAVRGDLDAAWRHARAAEAGGDPGPAEMLARHAGPPLE